MTADEALRRKLERVERIWTRWGEPLRGDRRLGELLRAYLAAFAQAEEVGRRVGAAAFCARCGREGRGSCCGEDMEFHCEDVLLLANLLAGVQLPPRRVLPGRCFFLGPEGCLLRVRPLICRNFLCPELARHLGPRQREVQEALGPEAEALFRLCDHLRRLLPGL